MATSKKQAVHKLPSALPVEGDSQDIVGHLQEILAWLDTKFKLIESDKLPVKMYILKYLGVLNLLPASMAKWEKALLLSVLLNKDETILNKRLSKISYEDSLKTQIRHLTLVIELFVRLNLQEHVKAAEKDLVALVKKSNLV